MRRLQQRRSIAKFLCFLMILEMFVASPNVAEASVSKTISKNGREYCAVEGNKQTITVTLASPNKPENTKVVSSSVPSWASVSKPNYNSPVFKVTVQQNNGSGSRVENIEFTDGTNSWTLTLTQYVYKAPTTKPPTKPVTKEPTKKAPTPTKAPTSTPTPTPELTASEASLGFPADGATKTVTISGYTGTLRADRNDTWFTVSVSCGTISITATKNTSTARASYVDVTDTGSGRSVRIQVTQAAPIYNPEPTKAPTSTPTPVPAETLPISRKKMQFGAQGGQDTLSLTGTGYDLTFSFPDNPSVPTGWVGMVYDGKQIKVKVDRNKDYASRSMKVKISDRKTNQYAYVTINQSAAPTPTPAYLNVDRKEISCDAKGGEEIVTLKGLVGVPGYSFTWEPAADNGWVKVKPEGSKLRFTIDENRSIKTRTATILIKDSQTKKDVTVTIRQEAMSNTTKVSTEMLGADPGTISFDYEGGEQSAQIYGKSGILRVDSVGSATWFSASIDGMTLTINAEENPGHARQGFVDVTDTGSGKKVRVEVYQDVKPVKRSLEIDHRALTFSSSKGTQTVFVSGRAGKLVLGRRNNNTWFTVVEENGLLTITVTENDGAPRTGYLDITDTGTGESAWVAIYQNSKSMDENPSKEKDYTPSLSIDGLRCEYGWEKSTDQIPLNSQELLCDFFYDWNRENDQNWAKVWFDGENLCISVDENENENYRSVVVSIHGPLTYLGEITITQQGAPIKTQLAYDHQVLYFGTNGGTQEAVITGLSGAPTIKKSLDASWLSIEEVGPFLEKDPPYNSGYRLRFSVPENDGGERKTPIDIIDTKTGQQIRMAVYQSPAPGNENTTDSDSSEEGESDDSSFKNLYLVKYDANGGTNPPSPQTKWHSTDPDYALILTTDKPMRLGYEFVGWGVSPTSTRASYQPGDRFTKNMDVTLYAIWESNGFWERYEVTHSIHEPYNSAVAGAKGITMDQYWKMFQDRKKLYISKNIDASLSDPWKQLSAPIEGVERKYTARELKYILGVLERTGLHRLAGLIGDKAIIVPDAAYMLGYYFNGGGEKLTYGLDHYLYSGSLVMKCFDAEVNDIMRKMEGGLSKNQSVVFTDKNAAKNRISFNTKSYSGTETDASYDLNGFFGIKEGSYGLSGKCSFDGEVYTMDICFYLQDFYDFYYGDNDPNSQSRYQLAGVYGDELAFLVAWGLAKPFENTGVLHVQMTWHAGQKADLMRCRAKRWYGEDDTYASMSVIPFAN